MHADNDLWPSKDSGVGHVHSVARIAVHLGLLHILAWCFVKGFWFALS